MARAETERPDVAKALGGNAARARGDVAHRAHGRVGR